MSWKNRIERHLGSRFGQRRFDMSHGWPAPGRHPALELFCHNLPDLGMMKVNLYQGSGQAAYTRALCEDIRQSMASL